MLQQHYAPYSEKRINMTINVLKDYRIDIQNPDSLDMLIEEAILAQIQCDYIDPLKMPLKTLGAIIVPIIAFVVRRHIVVGANRTVFSPDSPTRLCRAGTYRAFLPAWRHVVVALFERQHCCF